MSFSFLSPEWIAAAKEIRQKYADEAARVTTSIRLNGVVTDTPFGSAPLQIALDTSSGTIFLDLPQFVVEIRQRLVEQDQAGAMQAFMSGRIKVQGDMMKLMALQTQMPDDEIAKTISHEISDITA